MPDLEPLTLAVLQALAQGPAEGMALPRLGKQLGQSASTLLRLLAPLGDEAVGGVGTEPGPGWVRVVMDEAQGRWRAVLTDAGCAAVAHTMGMADASTPSMPPPLETVGVTVAQAGQPDLQREDVVAAEVPVALVFNGLSHAVMMATPQDLEDFALGFALSEGIADDLSDFRSIEAHALGSVSDSACGTACEVQIEISSRSFAHLKEQRRSLAGRTGCGLCGIDSLAALDLQPAPMPPRPWQAQIDRASVLRALAALPAQQPLNAAAGALHAAGWAAPDGSLQLVREDVGRHNALDKLLGHLARSGRLDEPGYVVMSSRASYELVRKCARLNVAALATISAPTSLAVQIAEQAGLRLWGLCRGSRAVLYGVGGGI